jgi:hypothetical protein
MLDEARSIFPLAQLDQDPFPSANIPLPMSLPRIIGRLQNSYYRSRLSVFRDVQQLRIMHQSHRKYAIAAEFFTALSLEYHLWARIFPPELAPVFPDLTSFTDARDFDCWLEIQLPEVREKFGHKAAAAAVLNGSRHHRNASEAESQRCRVRAPLHRSLPPIPSSFFRGSDNPYLCFTPSEALGIFSAPLENRVDWIMNDVTKTLPPVALWVRVRRGVKSSALCQIVGPAWSPHEFSQAHSKRRKLHHATSTEKYSKRSSHRCADDEEDDDDDAVCADNDSDDEFSEAETSLSGDDDDEDASDSSY